MSRVAVVDTKLCNLHSIARALEECGAEPLITDQPRDLQSAARIVLPGVGAFPKAMDRLRSTGLADGLREQVIEQRIPFLGICLGMQLLAASGTEVEPTAGLGWIAGEVRQLAPEDGERIPHIGWNEVDPQGDAVLFRGIDPGRDFYFVHSYALYPEASADVAALTSYGGEFVSAVQRELVFGVQFHPEKSQRAGFQVLRNFLSV